MKMLSVVCPSDLLCALVALKCKIIKASAASVFVWPNEVELSVAAGLHISGNQGAGSFRPLWTELRARTFHFCGSDLICALLALGSKSVKSSSTFWNFVWPRESRALNPKTKTLLVCRRRRAGADGTRSGGGHGGCDGRQPLHAPGPAAAARRGALSYPRVLRCTTDCTDAHSAELSHRQGPLSGCPGVVGCWDSGNQGVRVLNGRVPFQMLYKLPCTPLLASEQSRGPGVKA